MAHSKPFEKLSAHARAIIRACITLAQEGGAKEITPQHLLTAILSEKDSLGSVILKELGIRLEEFGTPPSPSRPKSEKKPALSRECRSIITNAFLLAHRFSYPYVGSEHLVHSLLEANLPEFAPLFSNKSTTSKKGRSFPLSSNLSPFPDLTRMMDFPDVGFIGNRRDDRSETPALREYGVRLGIPSQRSFLSRSKEIESVLRTLGRKTKSNPLLLGEPGVGKTAIVEAVAEKIRNNEAGRSFRGAEIILLDLSAIVAGTNYRGEFEARLRDIIKEAREHPNIILFLDEIHTLIGAGNANGTLDAANILKPALSRGDIRCIGATTFSEYKRHIQKDPALERRFQPIRVSEPNAETAVNILLESRADYESHHCVTIGEEAIRAAVSLSVRHLSGRFLPDKAFDVLDESASLVRRRATRENDDRKLNTLSLKLDQVTASKEKLVREKKFEKAESLRNEEIALNQSLQILVKEIDIREKSARLILTEKDVAEAVALITDTPTRNILDSRNDSISTLFPRLSEAVVGQEEAIRSVCRGIVQSHIDKDPERKRPLRSFLFLGPSGVGKTLTATKLAEIFFGTTSSFLRFDMSEFGERHATAQMIGSPAGYVGYGEGGKLTEHIRHHPASVILFDEIEKAHPDVLNLLLQILDEGILTDAEGKTARFGESIVILTSNIGTRSFLRENRIGFGAQSTPLFDTLREEALREVKQIIRPELLARLDEPIVFRPLEKESLSAIARRELDRFFNSLSRSNIVLRYDSNVVWHIGEQGFGRPDGARAIRKLIETTIEAPIAERFLGEYPSFDTISLSISPENKLIIETSTKNRVIRSKKNTLSKQSKIPARKVSKTSKP